MPKLPPGKINLSSSNQEIVVPAKTAHAEAVEQVKSKRKSKPSPPLTSSPHVVDPTPTDEKIEPAIAPENSDPKLNALMRAGAIHLNLTSEGDILFNADVDCPSIATIANHSSGNFLITITYLDGKKIEPAIAQTKVILIADTLPDARSFLNEKGFH